VTHTHFSLNGWEHFRDRFHTAVTWFLCGQAARCSEAVREYALETGGYEHLIRSIGHLPTLTEDGLTDDWARVTCLGCLVYRSAREDAP
jgi:hypothetical protein